MPMSRQTNLAKADSFFRVLIYDRIMRRYLNIGGLDCIADVKNGKLKTYHRGHYYNLMLLKDNPKKLKAYLALSRAYFRLAHSFERMGVKDGF